MITKLVITDKKFEGNKVSFDLFVYHDTKDSEGSQTVVPNHYEYPNDTLADPEYRRLKDYVDRANPKQAKPANKVLKNEEVKQEPIVAVEPKSEALTEESSPKKEDKPRKKKSVTKK